MVATHLIGIIYAAMSGILALLLADQGDRKRLLAIAGAAAAGIIVFLLAEHLVNGTDFVNPLLFFSGHSLSGVLQATAQNVHQV